MQERKVWEMDYKGGKAMVVNEAPEGESID